MSYGSGGEIFQLQTLELRQLLAVSLDAGGWTVVTPSVDTRTVYVSSSGGDDANDGLSPATAVASLARAKALVRDGMPDHLLLKRGDAWSEAFNGWTKSGRSPDEPLLIGAYGEATAPRPLLLTGGVANAFLTTNDPVDYLYVIGIEMTPGPARGTANPTGLMLLAPADTLHVEDTVVRGYANNVTLRGAQGPVRGVTFRRSLILDAHGFGTHAQGLYAYQVDGLTLEENLFDHNGWSESVPGAPATVYNHNAYVKENVTGLVARRNVFARASSHGLQARGGGVIEGNLFLDNPIGLSFGLVNGSPVTPGGVTGVIAGNVFLGGRDIGGSPRGWAIEVSNTAAGRGGTLIEDNVFAHDTQDAYAAIRLHLGSGVSNPAEAVGINDLTVRRNTVYGWHAALWTHGFLTPGGVGEHALNDLVVADNDFRQALSGQLVQHDSAFSAVEERWSGNRYWDDDPAGGWFEHGGVGLTLEAWRALAEPTALLAASAADGFPDPTRDVGSYMGSLGGGGTANVAAFLGQARLQSAANWRPQYTARPVVDYVRTGFGLAPVVEDTTAPSTSMPYGTVRMIRSTSISPKTGYRFTVVYADDGILNASTLKTGNLLITGPDGYNQLPSFVSSKTRSDGSILAEYRFNPPGGAWDIGDNSMYKLRLGPDPVQDLAGNATQADSLGTIIVYLTETADQPLTTIGLNASAVTESTIIQATSSYTFKVTYLPHEYDMRSGSIGDGDIVVVNDKGFSELATLVSKKRGSKPGSIVAKYAIKPPGGTWSGGDSATYTIVLRKREVRDVEGHYVPAGKLGRFKVSLASGGQVVITPQPIGSSDRVVLGLAYTGATEDLFNSEKRILAG